MSDEQGRFVFEKVPPGLRQLARYLKPQSRPGLGPIGLSHTMLVDVKAGQTTRVRLGGDGRAITGRMVASRIESPLDWQWDIHQFKTKVRQPNLPPPPKYDAFASQEEFFKATTAVNAQHDAFWSSEEGKALQLAVREFTPIFNPDGSFRIDDVPPGAYELTVKVSRRTTESFNAAETQLGASTNEVIVVAAPNNEPLNLGDLELQPVIERP